MVFAPPPYSCGHPEAPRFHDSWRLLCRTFLEFSNVSYRVRFTDNFWSETTWFKCLDLLRTPVPVPVNGEFYWSIVNCIQDSYFYLLIQVLLDSPVDLTRRVVRKISMEDKRSGVRYVTVLTLRLSQDRSMGPVSKPPTVPRCWIDKTEWGLGWRVPWHLATFFPNSLERGGETTPWTRVEMTRCVLKGSKRKRGKGKEGRKKLVLCKQPVGDIKSHLDIKSVHLGTYDLNLWLRRPVTIIR